MKTKALISFAVTAKLICVFVFAYAKSRFSHDEAQFSNEKIVIFTMYSNFVQNADHGCSLEPRPLSGVHSLYDYLFYST